MAKKLIRLKFRKHLDHTFVTSLVELADHVGADTIIRREHTEQVSASASGEAV